jgi:hypothetical protein
LEKDVGFAVRLVPMILLSIAADKPQIKDNSYDIAILAKDNYFTSSYVYINIPKLNKVF